jgi:hypothetical protein
MLLPSSPSSVMSLPSYWFRIKNTRKIREVDYCHWDGEHLRMKRDLRWYKLDELQPISEIEFKNELDKLRQRKI